MFKSIPQVAVRELIIKEFGKGNTFTMEELWFRFHEKYIYSSRKELENTILNMTKQNKIEVLTGIDEKELFFLPKDSESTIEKNPEAQRQIKSDSNEGCQQNRKALKEIKENELNLRHLKPQ